MFYCLRSFFFFSLVKQNFLFLLHLSAVWPKLTIRNHLFCSPKWKQDPQMKTKPAGFDGCVEIFSDLSGHAKSLDSTFSLLSVIQGKKSQWKYFQLGKIILHVCSTMTPPSDQEDSHTYLCSARKEHFHALENTSKGTLKSEHRHIGGFLPTLKDKSQTKDPREYRRTV